MKDFCRPDPRQSSAASWLPAPSGSDRRSPLHRAPVAQAQSITVSEGQATPITLTGTDPDGDAVQFVVTQQPLLGTLTGTAPNLIYTSYADVHGADSLQFFVTDGMLLREAILDRDLT